MHAGRSRPSSDAHCAILVVTTRDVGVRLKHQAGQQLARKSLWPRARVRRRRPCSDPSARSVGRVPTGHQVPVWRDQSLQKLLFFHFNIITCSRVFFKASTSMSSGLLPRRMWPVLCTDRSCQPDVRVQMRSHTQYSCSRYDGQSYEHTDSGVGIEAMITGDEHHDKSRRNHSNISYDVSQ